MCGPFLLSYAASGARPASVPSGAGAHVGINWTRPASVLSGVGAHVGISWTRPRPSLPGWGTSRASAASGMARAARYYRAGGRANGRHPRRASLFLEF